MQPATTTTPIVRRYSPFIRYAVCRGLSGDNRLQSVEAVKARFPGDRELEVIARAAVNAQGTGDFPAQASASREWIETWAPRTAFGRLVGWRPVAMEVLHNVIDTPGSFAWAAEGAWKPLTAFVLAENLLLRAAKFAGAVVVSKELVRASNAEQILNGELTRRMVVETDRLFFDPSVEATADSPGAVTADAEPIPSSGSTAATILSDVRALLGALTHTDLTSVFLIASTRVALFLATLLDASGALAFPTVTATGGSLAGIPFLAAGGVPDGILIALDAAQLAVADPLRAVVSTSENADVFMVDNPAAGAATGQQLVSLFQVGAVGFRIERWVNWKLLRPSAVGFIANFPFVPEVPAT